MRPLRSSILLFVVFVATDFVKADETRQFTISELESKQFEKCANEAGLKLENFEEVMTKKLEGDADQKFKCFHLCVYQIENVINNGQIDANNLVKYYDAEKTEIFKEVLLNCAEKSSGTDDCDLAYNVEKCIYLASKKKS